MKKTLRVIIYVVVCLSLIVSLFSGCNNKKETAPAQTQETQKAAETKAADTKAAETASSDAMTLKLPIVQPGSVTLKIGTFDNWYAPASYASNLAIFQAIEKDTGVKINWEVSPPAQWNTQMQTRLAAGGDDLPDIICVPWGETMKWASAGTLQPLEELVDKFAPNMKKFFSEQPEVKALNYAPDGHMYKISSYVSESAYVNPWLFTIRKDWLDKLQLKVPESTDDWYNVLKAFKEKDPNGNGKADEIPYTIEGPHYLSRFAECFGLRAFYSGYQYPDASGKVIDQRLTDQFKAYLTWVNKLYKEKLLDNEFAGLDLEKKLAKVNRNIVGATGTFISNIPSFNSNLQKAGFADANYVPCIPPKGPYGNPTFEAYGPISGDFAITSVSKNKEVAIKWLDYVYASPEGIRYCMYGIEGKSYVMENGKIKLTDFTLKNPDGLGPFEALRSLGAWPNVPYQQKEEAYKAILLAPYPELSAITEKVKPYLVFGWPPILSSKEETDQLSSISADLNTYMEEMTTKFIIGTESLDKFDDFKNQVKALGVDKILAIKQAQWDRHQKALKGN